MTLTTCSAKKADSGDGGEGEEAGYVRAVTVLRGGILRGRDESARDEDRPRLRKWQNSIGDEGTKRYVRCFS